MADNTTLVNGDVIRDIQKGGAAGPKTPVSVIDVGGAGTEALLTAGQAAMAASVPVVIASNQSAVPVSAAALPLPAGAALESGGNLASIAGKDFASQTTLAALNGKVTAVNTGAVVLAAGSAVIGHVIVDSGNITTTIGALAAGENHIGAVGGHTVTPSANFNRPADTTAYATGDLLANSVTAGSVVPLSFTAARVATGSGMVRRARLKKSGTTVTLASFRLHLYGADPSAAGGISNGDNGAWLTKAAGYLGAVDLDMSGVSGRVFSDAAEVIGVPVLGTEMNFSLASGTTVYGLLEARAAYVPASGETFTVELEVLQN